MLVFKLALLTLVIFLVSSFNQVIAAEDSLDAKQSIATSSFELFWPLTAGKTAEDSTYFLKRWKEDLRGFLIFGSAQKANYNILLATKRVLEVEKLVSEKKSDLARKTMDSASDNLKAADNSLVKEDTKGISQEKKSILDRLKNLESFLPRLSQMSGDDANKVNQLLETVKSLISKAS